MSTTGIKIENLNKSFFTLRGKKDVLKELNLDVKSGEFFILLGPSGCGKSTLLNLISGLIEPTGGKICFDDTVVVSKHENVFFSPVKREIAFVFQSYALYPHMTVRQNIEFPLTNLKNKLSKHEMLAKVKETARILQIEELLDCKPKELSGGQRQRVAIGRAIVRNPKVFLMDEPLSNLDARLRVDMRAELKMLQSRLGITTIYVTHDQLEAMTLGDRVAIMEQGVIRQVGTPVEIYNEPKNLFVAKFIGSPAMNIIEGNVVVKNNKVLVESFLGEISISDEVSNKIIKFDYKKVKLGIRPEHFIFFEKGKGDIELAVDIVENLGSEYIVYLSFGKERIIVKSLDKPKSKRVSLKLDADKIYFFDVKGDRI